MAKKTSEKIKEAVESIAKPVTLPFSFMCDRLSELKKRWEKAPTKKEVVSTVDGFVDTLIEEAADAEKGLFAFFSEMLFVQNLAEEVASLENELTLMEILGRRTVQFLQPDFVLAYSKSTGNNLTLVFRYPGDQGKHFPVLDKIAAEDLARVGEFLHENIEIDRRLYTVVSVPLRSTSEQFGILLIGRQQEKAFRPHEISLAVAAAAVVGFMLSNMKLHQQILRDKQLVAVGETMAGLSHDIRNILTNLEGGLQLLDLGLREKKQKTINQGYSIVRRSYEKMKELVLAMVDFSRQREPDLTPTRLNDLLADIVASLKERCREKKVKLKQQLDENVPVMLLDPWRMERLVSNLLFNALEAVEEGKGLILIGTKYYPEESMVHLWVKDNGCGIHPQLQDKIFDIFYSTKGARGTGFGLAIAQKVVREHGGTIQVHSQPGKGATFLVKLPVRFPEK